MLNLGKLIQQYRTAHGLTQNELAADICFRSTIVQVEANRMIPSEEILQKIAVRLDMPLPQVLELRRAQMEVRTKLLLLKAFLEASEFSKAFELLADLKGHELLEHQEHERTLFEAEYLLQTSDPGQAIDCLRPLQERLETATEPDDELLTHLYNKLGKAYFAAGDTVNACTYYTKGYNLSKRVPSLVLLTAEMAYNLGRVWMKNGLSTGASDYFKEADMIFNQIIGTQSLPVQPVETRSSEEPSKRTAAGQMYH